MHVMTNFKDKTKCIDDTLLWRENLEQSFFRTCEYLTLCSNAGIVFNLKKFQLGQQEVDFLGLRITMNSIRSNPEYLEAITNFHDQGTSKGYAVGLALCNRWLMPFHRLILCYPFVTYWNLLNHFYGHKRCRIALINPKRKLWKPWKMAQHSTLHRREPWRVWVHVTLEGMSMRGDNPNMLHQGLDLSLCWV